MFQYPALVEEHDHFHRCHLLTFKKTTHRPKSLSNVFRCVLTVCFHSCLSAAGAHLHAPQNPTATTQLSAGGHFSRALVFRRKAKQMLFVQYRQNICYCECQSQCNKLLTGALYTARGPHPTYRHVQNQ